MTKAKDGWAMAKVVSAKLEEGNYKGAVRLLMSEDAVTDHLQIPCRSCMTSTLLFHSTDATCHHPATHRQVYPSKKAVFEKPSCPFLQVPRGGQTG